MQPEGLIDSARFDEEETIPRTDVIHALARERLARRCRFRRSTAGSGSRRRHTRASSARSRASTRRSPCSSACTAGSARRRSCCSATPSRRRATSRCSRAARRSPRTRSPSPRPAPTRRTSRRTARLSADGSHWMLNGRKQWIGNGHRAGVIATFAQTPVRARRRDGAASDGVHHPPRHARLPRRRHRSQDRHSRLDAGGARLRELAGPGRPRARHRRQGIRRRRARAQRRAPDARRRLHRRHEAARSREMAEFAEQRVQFGKPIADFEITQRKLARIGDRHLRRRRDARHSELASRCVATSGGDCALEAACCKVFASEMLWRAADEMVQVGRRPRLREAVSVRAAAARLAHQSHLRGHERDPAAVHRAQRHPGAGRAAEGDRLGAAAAAAESRADQRVRRVAPARARSARRRRSTSTLHERLTTHKRVLREARRRAAGGRPSA